MKPYKKNTNTISKKYLRINFLKIWEITLFSSITTCLGIFLLSRGWAPIYKDQVTIQGAVNTPREKVFQAMEVIFPIKVLAINPKRLERNLQRNLSIKSVAISRRIAPLGIYVEILEKDPVAIAFRAGEQGQEKGLVDKEGHWIEIYESDHGKNEVIIDGWTKNNKKVIALILKNQKKFGISLQRIILNPSGSISLQTKEFMLVQLGNQPELLTKQLEAIAHLSKSLPDDLVKNSETILNLKNPSKPKLFLPNEKD